MKGSVGVDQRPGSGTGGGNTGVGPSSEAAGIGCLVLAAIGVVALLIAAC